MSLMSQKIINAQIYSLICLIKCYLFNYVPVESTNLWKKIVALKKYSTNLWNKFKITPHFLWSA